uniref:Uncharacterized protein n=1 Tax=Cyprinodon variegatus TaxID=28743 RepID=A0A3Q2C868_CYPVA
MSSGWNNYGLPFIPGYSFRDLTKSSFHRSQTLSYRNGYAMPRRPSVGIGQEPLLSEQLTQQTLHSFHAQTENTEKNQIR